ncbi:thioredoxin family protein [Candidatus Beckwithbacteria bacterium]|nr:thioredoxin family protein [Candidatus Beckwithbacteria bacterium]
MKLTVYGAGCQFCQNFYQTVEQAVKELDLKVETEYSHDIAKVISLGIIQMPVLMLDDKVILTGNPGNLAKLKAIIKKEIGE